MIGRRLGPERSTSDDAESPPRLGTWLAIAVALLVMAWRGLLLPLEHLSGKPSDFAAYWQAARALADGASPWSSPGYIYPGLPSLLLYPFGLLDFEVARRAWLVTSFAALLAAVALLGRRLGRVRPGLAAVPFLTAAAVGTVSENAVLGQLQPLLLLLLALAWVARERPFLGATALGAAAALKLWPALLLLGDLAGRRWRSMAVAGVAFGLLGFVPTFLLQRLPGPDRPASVDFLAGSPGELNASVSGAALRLATLPEQGDRLPPSWRGAGGLLQTLELEVRERRVGFAAFVATLLVGTGVVWHRRLYRYPDRCFAALLLVGLLAVPVSWYHYRLLHVLTVAVACVSLPRRRAVAVAALCLLSSWSAALLVGGYHAVWGPFAVRPLLLYLATVTPTVAEAAAFAVIAAPARAGRAG